jgi:hypothetical protein
MATTIPHTFNIVETLATLGTQDEDKIWL